MMNKCFSILILLVGVISGILPSEASADGSLGIKALSVVPSEDRFGVEFTFDPSEWSLSTNKLVRVTPVLKAKESVDSILFPSVSIGGKNAYFYNIRDDNGKSDRLFRAGKGPAGRYYASVPFEKWMESSELDFRVETSGCCGVKKGPDSEVPAVGIDLIPREFSAVLSCTPPAAKATKERKIHGRAYVSFPVNRTEIFPDYMINPRELRKIMASIDTVKDDPDAVVRSIHLTGYASPEGPYDNNVRLAKGRTEAVKNYVARQYPFPSTIYHTSSVPEDWAGLRDSIAVSFLEDRNEMLAFIDNPGVPVARQNDVFRTKFPTSYAYLLKNIYPWLRHTDYEINYEVRQYTDVEEIKRIMKTNPRNLDLNEFYLAANSYGVGTPEYDDVFMTAVILYPEDPMANLNAGLAAMSRGDYDRAATLLSHAGDGAEADYARATLEALLKNWSAAASLFEKAGSKGDPRAEEALKELERVSSVKQGVTVFPDFCEQR